VVFQVTGVHVLLHWLSGGCMVGWVVSGLVRAIVVVVPPMQIATDQPVQVVPLA
jgi:hypothetical protein